MNNEIMYMIKVTRDDDGYWGYDKTFEHFLSTDRSTAFNKALEELSNLYNTVRGRNHYTEQIKEDINNFLDGTNVNFHDNYLNTNTLDIFYGFDFGNASFTIEIIEVLVTRNSTDFSFIEIQ